LRTELPARNISSDVPSALESFDLLFIQLKAHHVSAAAEGDGRNPSLHGTLTHEPSGRRLVEPYLEDHCFVRRCHCGLERISDAAARCRASCLARPRSSPVCSIVWEASENSFATSHSSLVRLA